MPDDVLVSFSSLPTTSTDDIPSHQSLSLDSNDKHYNLGSSIKNKLIQFKPTNHDIFHSSHFNGPSFKQIILVFLMFVLVTSLCSYLYKDSLINLLLILETLPWWWTSLFFCLLFTLVSLPFAWGKSQKTFVVLCKDYFHSRIYSLEYSMWFSLWFSFWCDIDHHLRKYWFICIILSLSICSNT